MMFCVVMMMLSSCVLVMPVVTVNAQIPFSNHNIIKPWPMYIASMIYSNCNRYLNYHVQIESLKVLIKCHLWTINYLQCI